MMRRALLLAVACFAPMAWGSARSVALADVSPGSSPERLQSVCEYGIACAFQGDLSKAESAFVQVLNQSPGDPRALTNLGNLEILNGRTRLALSFYDKAALADSNDPGIVLNQATALYLLSDTTAALTYARGIELAGGFLEAANLLGLYIEPEEPDSRAADRSRLRKDELLSRLALAEKLIPADTMGTPPDTTHTRKKHLRTRRGTRYRIGAARAGEDAIATVLYWGH